jgi:predicted NUDIX family phosphoesterase
MKERVLVLPRAEVPGGTDFTGIRPATDGDATTIREVVARSGAWMDRDLAEQDPSHKQLIPYVVVRDRSGPAERVFLMERTDAGGDPRLHRRATIGVGGHLNPVDDGADPLAAGLRREWREELDAAWEPEFSPIGLLNDDRNPVGSVHLGVVFEVEAAGRDLDVRERHKLSGRMVAVAELAGAWDRMETWSQLVAASIWGEPGA